MKMRNPSVGSTVPLLLTRFGRVKFDVDDPRIAIRPDHDKADRAKRERAYEQALKGHEDRGK
jgi:hypothetical protein